MANWDSNMWSWEWSSVVNILHSSAKIDLGSITHYKRKTTNVTARHCHATHQNKHIKAFQRRAILGLFASRSLVASTSTPAGSNITSLVGVMLANKMHPSLGLSTGENHMDIFTEIRKISNKIKHQLFILEKNVYIYTHTSTFCEQKEQVLPLLL